MGCYCVCVFRVWLIVRVSVVCVLLRDVVCVAAASVCFRVCTFVCACCLRCAVMFEGLLLLCVFACVWVCCACLVFCVRCV